jgi:hypothetical protein
MYAEGSLIAKASCPVKESTSLQTVVASAHHQVETLDKALENLYAKLNPIIRPEEANIPSSPRPSYEPGAVLRNSMIDLVVRLENIVERVHRITEQTDL